MTRTYLMRGMLVGLIAGLCAVAFAKVVAEPQIGRAERFEHQLDVQRGLPTDRPLVSRDVQDTIGLGTGILVAGAAIGGLYGLAFAAVYRRLTQAGAQVTAALLAAAAFVAVFLVPFLKYPANPPSIGSPDTIGRRTALYFLLMAIGALSTMLAVTVQRRSVARFGAWNATLLGTATFIAIAVVSYVGMPGVNEVPAGFPPTVLWQFRLAALGTQVVLWATLGLVFGALTQHNESTTLAVSASS
jgi:predicted cobalt transporter CbtA